jgi:hypothetical protein
VQRRAEAVERTRGQIPLVELARQHEAFPVVRDGSDRIAALEHEVAEIVEVHLDSDRIADVTADVEGFLTQRFAPCELTPLVICPSEVAKYDLDLPIVTDPASDR